MNVGIIVTSYWAYGELLIALQFAKRIKKYGYEPYFFIPPSHKQVMEMEQLKYCMFIPNVGALNKIFLQDYENTYHPEFIILSDFLNYNFCEKDYGLTIDDLKIFSGKLGTFDNFDWALKKRKMDTYGFGASIASKVNIDDYGFKLVPCPIGNLNEQNTANKFYYPLVDEFLEYDEEIKKKTRKELNLNINKPMVLVTSATWQDTYKKYPKVIKCVEYYNAKFAKLLEQLSVDMQIVIVGKKTNMYLENKYGNMIFMDNMMPDLFEKYALASDLYISRNVTSTSMAKLACSGIPTLVAISSMNSYDNTEMYPYRMFPVGWYNFLEPLYENNEYMKLIIEEEITDIEAVYKHVQKIVYDNDYREEFRSNAYLYRKKLEELKKPEEILEILSL